MTSVIPDISSCSPSKCCKVGQHILARGLILSPKFRGISWVSTFILNQHG